MKPSDYWKKNYDNMKKNYKYWKKRSEQIESSMNNKANINYKEWDRLYSNAQSEIDKQIRSWYQRFADNNGITMSQAMQRLSESELKELKWDVNQYIEYGQQNAMNQQWMKELENASAKFHINRLEALKLHIRQQIETVFSNGQLSMFDMLADVYQESFYHSCFEIAKGFGIGFNVSRISDKQLKTILSKPWAVNGTNFSTKLWGNKETLINNLNNELSRMVLTGESPHKTIARISKQLGASKSNVGRLVMTEQAYFTTLGQQDCYSDLDVEEYEFVATLDKCTCDKCAPLDGRHWKVKDMIIGVNAAPIHPWCRCTSIPYFDDEFVIGERAARDKDGNTVPVSSDMTYSEWHKQYVDSDPEYKLSETKYKNRFQDEKQYNEYKTVLGKKYVPKNLDEFQTMKYTDSKEYNILKAQEKGMTYYNKAIDNEPLITSTVKKIAKSNEMDMLGLEYRLKTKDSYLGKIRRDYSEGKSGYEINDIIRYTYGADANNLVDKTLSCIDDMKNMGYNTVKVKNFWLDELNPYNGINTTVQAPNGQKFEIQYHTKESFELKNSKEMHGLYEKQRVLTDEYSDEYIELTDKMFELSNGLETPKGIERVKKYG